jgi:hypothetical protein
LRQHHAEEEEDQDASDVDHHLREADESRPELEVEAGETRQAEKEQECHPHNAAGDEDEERGEHRDRGEQPEDYVTERHGTPS